MSLKVLKYLDCGCSIMADGSRTWCPSCLNDRQSWSPPRRRPADEIYVKDIEGDLLRAWVLRREGKKANVNVSVTDERAGVVTVVSISVGQAKGLADWIKAQIAGGLR